MRNFEMPTIENAIVHPEKKQGEIWEESIDFVKGELRNKIQQCVSDPEKFLGKGGAAKVFDLGDQCIKLVLNRHASSSSGKYKLGNSMARESDIQNSLHDLTVDGVFAPRVIGYMEGQEAAAMVMEKLDAINLQDIFNGNESFPANFDRDTFFDGLEQYIYEMHDRGVAHYDLEPRNVMVDCQTGVARVIDFGVSQTSDNEDLFRKAQNDDIAKLDQIYDILYNSNKE